MKDKHEYIPESRTITVDFKANEQLRTQGISLHWWNADTTDLHNHNFYEFFIITQGAAVHEINGECRLVKKGTLNFIRPNDCHRISAQPEQGCIHMNISITEEKLEKICRALEITAQALCERSKRSAILGVNDLQFFKSRAEKINMLEHNGFECDYFLYAELAVRAVSALLSSEAAADMEYPEWFAAILEKIHSPSFYACTAADVYKLGNFSPPVMIDYFRKYTGKTVKQYLKDLKIAIACDFLMNSELPILELSNLLGYASLSHFNRIFKEYTGLTPAAYRKGTAAAFRTSRPENQNQHRT